MEKLNEHLFEVDPITFEFEIGKTNPAVGSIGSIQKRVYQVPVDCFSPSQQKLLDFLVKYNYEFSEQEKDIEDVGFMGVIKNQLLSDSVKGTNIKKREMK